MYVPVCVCVLTLRINRRLISGTTHFPPTNAAAAAAKTSSKSSFEKYEIRASVALIVKMSIFEAYDTEFSSLKQEISKNVDEYRSSSDNSEKSGSLLRLIDALFMQSNDLIKQMEVEARSSDSSSRKVMNERVSEYKKAVQQLKNDSQFITTQKEKAALLGVSKSGEQRQRLLDTNDR